jgi:hypothetical protein
MVLAIWIPPSVYLVAWETFGLGYRHLYLHPSPLYNPNASLIPSVKFDKIFEPPAVATSTSLYESLSQTISIHTQHALFCIFIQTYARILTPSGTGSGLLANSSVTMTPKLASVIGATLGRHPSSYGNFSCSNRLLT